MAAAGNSLLQIDGMSQRPCVIKVAFPVNLYREDCIGARKG
jgi:hypothetical protein